MSHCWQVVPTWFRRQEGDIFHGALYCIATQHQDDYLRLALDHCVPIEPEGASFLVAEAVETSCHVDHLRHPVAAAHDRLSPFKMQHARARCCLRRALRHGGNAGLQTSYNLLASGFGTGGSSYPLDISEHVADALRVKGQNLRRLCQPQTAFRDLAGRDRAHLTDRLAQQQIRLSSLQYFQIHFIDAKAFLQALSNNLADCAAA
jgi:hypothetical protein